MSRKHTLETFATEVLQVGGAVVALNSDKYLLGDALLDGGFEIWTSATVPRCWTPAFTGTSSVDREGTTKYAGTYGLALTISATNQNASVTQRIHMIPGQYRTLSFYYRNSTSGKTSKVTIADSGGNVYLQSDGTWLATTATISLPNSNGVWTLFSLTFKVHGSYSSYDITFANNSAASSTIYIDSAKLIEEATNREIFPKPATEAFAVLETAEIRFTTSGAAPTAANGQPLEALQNYEFENLDRIRLFQAIATTATAGLLTVEYRRQ